MEGEEGEGLRLSKRFSDKGPDGEVDYKTKAGTAWSHSYLNQKPWHPLSYPNQRRKWIAEQTHAQRERRAEEVAREYSQEQEFFRQTALISKKEKEKVEMMKAVSFMYVRPPGYNAESAKAAEIADESKKQELNDPLADGESTAMPPESVPVRGEEKKKPRPKDVFGRALPTEEEFEVLKNAPRLETGVQGRAKPFGVEVRNVKCLRCGNYGHQSGDRECPLKDAIMPNEESRLKRDDPLNAILAHTDPSEPLKWELKQKPGVSPPRGGFKPDDPNQQIVAEDIFDEYGGFLSGDNIPALLTNFSTKPKKSRKKRKQKRQQSSPNRELKDPNEDEISSADGLQRSKKKKRKMKERQHNDSESSSDGIEFDRRRKSRHKHSYSSEDSDADKNLRSKKGRDKYSYSSGDSDLDRHHRSDTCRQKRSFSSEDSDLDRHHRNDKRRHKNSYSYEDSDLDKHLRGDKIRHKNSHSFEDLDPGRHRRIDSSGHKGSYSSEDADLEKHHRRNKGSYSSKTRNQRHHRRNESRHKGSYSFDDSDAERHCRSDKSRHKHACSHEDSNPERHHRRDKSTHPHRFKDSDEKHRRSKY
ncbi:hypothetical protein F2P56_004231 [Juglans regia]|uniref:CBF1-interacting co-repressor CIR N-terminal domain-containing protein n=2 Tax=Juglans regia TaxID=51240 RepID=A0A833XUK9_JUGRE|nr:uncharacterized zinc finger CCHC domain-containing protein At4g19190 [Juglans regia]KAF5477611.1 hypothetical protein F2P56_004231 [Juglans regia]